ncbi:hypothetical protein BC828DRAFT_416259 [Blastocladiella britannica]|nr:hypothetical protein BC828DRAFT_416259 [Blastocladiella britannica]
MYHKIGGHCFRKLIGSDPGANKAQSLVIVETDGTSRDRALSRKEYIHGCGDNIANTKLKALEARSPEIKAINTRMPSLQVPTMAAIVDLFKYRWGHAMALRNFYLVPAQARIKRRNEKALRLRRKELALAKVIPGAATAVERAAAMERVAALKKVIKGLLDVLNVFRDHHRKQWAALIDDGVAEASAPVTAVVGV